MLIHQDYQNYFVWITKFSDLIEKIEHEHHISFDKKNYHKILDNLNQYLQIDDVIFNTELHPFLSNVVNAAITMPEKDFHIVFSEIFTPSNLSKLKLDKNKHQSIKQDIHQSLKDFFHSAENQLDQAISKKYPNFTHNLHFIDYEDIAYKAIKNFEKFNLNEPNLPALKQKFTNTINEFIQDPKGKFNISYKMDIIKPLIGAAGHFTEKNILQTDFDKFEDFNLNINKNSNKFPKFALWKTIANQKNDGHYGIACVGGWNYYPQITEKLFSVFTEHTIEHINDNLKFGFDPRLKYTYNIDPEKRYEILFEYLSSKQMSSNEDIENFIDKYSYQELKNDFSKYYNNYIKYTHTKQLEEFNNAHFNNSLANNLHILDLESNIMTDIKPNQEGKNASTWKINAQKVEKISQKKDIFEQINSGQLSFL